jgi:hypothetical protein
MPEPDDAASILTAVRLGYCMAEVRGRNRPDPPPNGQARAYSHRGGHELPLQFERTAGESRIAAQGVLLALAKKLGVDSGPQQSSYSYGIDQQAANVEKARLSSVAGPAGVGDPSANDPAALWAALTELFYKFDAHIQDSLSVQSDLQAGGYQLGRALAECYWALDPGILDDSQAWASWRSLLGAERCDEIDRLLGRLSAYLPSSSARAVAGSVRVWERVAASAQWRTAAYPRLFQQVGIWYELAALGRDPDTYVRAYARLRNSRIAIQAIRFFWGQMLLVALGIAALIVLVVLLGSGSSTAVINTALGIVAAAGVSTAGLSAGRFRRDLNIDMLAIAITTAPPPPKGHGRRQNQIYRLVRRRRA